MINNKITVVIPSVGRRSLLIQALRSLETQLTLPDEVVIVNSGSVVIHEVDIPIKLVGITKIINTTRKIGVSEARNLGVAASNCAFVGFLDDDDEWSMEVLNGFHDVYCKNSSLYYFPIFYRNVEGFYFRVKHANSNNKNELLKDLLRGNPGLGGSNLIIRKSVFENIGGFDENLRVSEDRDIAIRCLDNDIIPRMLNVGFATANVHGNSLSRTHIVTGQFKFYKKHREKLGVEGFLSVLWRIIKIYLAQKIKLKNDET